MYGETGYHGAYMPNHAEIGSGMHRSPSYQGKFNQASFNNDDHQTVDDSHASHGMPATHSDTESCAYQGHFGTTPGAKLFEPQHSGELERKGSTYHGRFGQQ